MWSPLAEVALVVLAQAVLAWALTYLAHSTLTIGLVWALDQRAERSGLDRTRLWRGAIVIPLLTASWSTLWWHAPLGLQFTPAWLQESWLVTAEAGAGVLGVVLLVVSFSAFSEARARREVDRHFGARRLLGDARRRPLDDLLRDAGWSGAVLTASSAILVPAAIGRREICVPDAFFRSMPVDEQRAVLAHELGHLVQSDAWWSRVSTAVARALMFQPLNRLAVTRLREAAEEAADDFAVRLTGDPGALARALTALASVVVIVAGGAAATGSPIVRRVTRLVSGHSAHPSRPPYSFAAAAALATLLLAGAAPVVPWDPDAAAHRLPWLAPSREDPNPRMLEVRQFVRHVRDVVR